MVNGMNNLRGMARLLAVGLALSAFSAVADDTRYVLATEANLRAGPQADSPVIARLPINTRLSLRGSGDGKWCEVGRPATAETGFISCPLLQASPVTLDALNQRLRPLAARLQDLLVKSPQELAELPPEARQSLTPLLDILERKFALSPSLYTYFAYARFSDRSSVLQRMQTDLNRDFSRDPVWPVLPVKPWRDGSPVTPATLAAAPRSLLATSTDIVGWLGGRSEEGTEGVASRHWFTALETGSLFNLAPVYEMAKAQRLAVNVDLTGKTAESTIEGNIPTGSLDTVLPVWAITADGLVPGKLVRLTLNGGACSAGEDETGAHFELDRAVKGPVFGFFATNRPFDPAKAVIKFTNRHWLDYGGIDAPPQTESRSESYTLDLNGDGIVDLAGGNKWDTETPYVDARLKVPSPAR